MRLLVFITLSYLFLSCSDNKPTAGLDNTVSSESLTRKAWNMRRVGKPVDEIITVQKQAVAQMRDGRSSDDPVEILEQMGYLYNIHGDYSLALKFYQEATDSLNSVPLDKRNDGAIQLFGDLSSLYSCLGMTELAIEYSDSAIVESMRQNGKMLSDVYRFRAGIYEEENDVKEAMRCYRLALKAVDNGASRTDKDILKALILGEMASLSINAYPDNMDSVNHAVTVLEKTLEYDDFDTTNRICALGLGYLKQGKTDKGIPLIKKAAESYREQNDLERVDMANRTLLATYARQGMIEDLRNLVPIYLQNADSMINLMQSDALIGAMVKYDIKSIEDKNRILTLQLEVEREHKTINYGVALFIIIALFCCSVIFYQRSRLLTQKKLLQEKKLKELNESNTMLNQRVDVLEKDLSASINSNNIILSEPQLITGKEEGRFRRAFSVLYPEFIPLLKEDFPKITPNDELLCMLLYLKHTTDEISIYLGISKASVNSARYRLRNKFSLPKDMDLDNFIIERKV